MSRPVRGRAAPSAKDSIMRRLVLAVLPLLLLILLILMACSCNTIEGAGRDLSVGGNFLADTASDLNPQNR
jgi:predicted small secreted protein